MSRYLKTRKIRITNRDANILPNGAYNGFSKALYAGMGDRIIGARISKYQMKNDIYHIIAGVNDSLVISGTAYTVAPGIYSALSSLASAVQTALAALSSTCTYDSTTNAFTIADPTTFTIDAASTILEMLGFSGAQTTATSHTSDIAPQITELDGELYIGSNSLSVGDYYQFDGQVDKNIISMVPAATKGNGIFYENEKEFPEISYPTERTIQKIDILMYFSDGTKMDNNGGKIVIEVTLYHY